MNKTIYTLGYHGRTVADIAKLLERYKATLFDIRFSPRSRIPEWNQGHLQRKFGDLYQHIPSLGNKNYQGTEIRIANFQLGLLCIRECPYQNIILMCVCRDHSVCHRTVVGKMLTEKGFRVQEIGGSQACMSF